MDGARAPVGAGGRTLAVAVSAGLHLILFLWLAWRLGQSPASPEPRVIEVRLTPAWRPSEAEPAPPRARPALNPPSSAALPVARPPGEPPREIAPPEVGEAVGARRVLRGLVGCDHAALIGLSERERERCRDRLAGEAREAAAGRALDLDPTGRFGEAAEPWLARKPRNGCRPRAGRDTAPSGEEGAAAGVSCAWAF